MNRTDSALPCALISRKRYRGEHSTPLVLQNLHRYFLYLALIFVVVLAFDAYRAMWFVDPATGVESFGIGVGTLVRIVNVCLLGSYTFGCHSFRHLVGGRIDVISETAVRHRAYRCVSCLNRRHMNVAWLSLFCVGFADLYVRLCSMGAWTDWRIL